MTHDRHGSIVVFKANKQPNERKEKEEIFIELFTSFVSY